jgi:large repetitive protein
MIWISLIQASFGQGLNNTQWVFGDCGDKIKIKRSILNFDAINGDVSLIPIDTFSIAGRQPLSKNTVATVINPLTGNLLFYTDGELLYDENHDNNGTNLNGDNGLLQGVAIAIGQFDMDPSIQDSYFVFYVTGAGNLGYQQVLESNGVLTLGLVNNTFKPDIGPSIKLIDKAKPNIGNESYLFYYDENVQQLKALNINGNTPAGWTEKSVALGLAPELIQYNEATNSVVVTASNGTISIIGFDRNSGEFRVPIQTFTLPGIGSENGLAFSPSGQYAYISQGNDLFQIDLTDLTKPPISLLSSPTLPTLNEVWDVKLAPNGKVYFMYEELGSSEVKIGVIDTPDLIGSDTDFELDIDPFDGVNFCGKMFPEFSTTVTFTPTVEILVPIDPGCEEKPLQLISKITPSTLVPVKYEWSFSDSTSTITKEVAHLVMAGSGSASVTLTVTFQDGTTEVDTKNVDFSNTPPEVELNLDPDVFCPCQDPKLPNPANGEGVDLAEFLSVDGTSPAPTSGFEYWWSAFPERGWTSNPEAKVCEPGMYYVMVRKTGEDCYGYAEVEVKIVDNSNGDALPSARNGKWFFGNKAGIDFNDYPLYPNGVRPPQAPRPLDVLELAGLVPPINVQNQHPQDITNGVDVYYDISGNVVFYSDGEQVWDFRHQLIPMPLGVLGLGGDRTGNQSVVIVPYPDPAQQALRTFFYIFTTQVNAPNEVKFTILDLSRGGVGASVGDLGKIIPYNNMTTPGVPGAPISNHLLFTGGTQQSASFIQGNTNFVAFREKGSGRYRVYKIDENGIGAANLTGVGTPIPSSGIISGVMQFSRGGKYLGAATTYQEGTVKKTRVEVFQFDAVNSDWNLYSTFSLNGEAYGLEFSRNEKRLFLSIDNKIEEFFLEAQDPVAGATGTNPFNTCINDPLNNNIVNRSQCIFSSRFSLGNGNYKALQRGPGPTEFLWVAVENANGIGFINERTNLLEQSQLLPPIIPFSGGGRLNKSLPRFKTPGGQGNLTPPSLIGDPEICLNITSIGLPITGIVAYDLLITGEVIDQHTFRFERRYQGQVTVPTLVHAPLDPQDPSQWEINFTEPGEYTIFVTVKRCDFVFDELSIIVNVLAPPFVLPAVVNFCDDGTPLKIKAIDESLFPGLTIDVEWRDGLGVVFNGNEYEIPASIAITGNSYTVTATLIGSSVTCPASTTVFVGPPRGLKLGIIKDEICFDGVLEAFPFDASSGGGIPSVSSGDIGVFRVFPIGSTTNPLFELKDVDRLDLNVKGLIPPGQYTLEFEFVDTFAFSSGNPWSPKCLIILREDFEIFPEPVIDFEVLSNSTCDNPRGEIIIRGFEPLNTYLFNGNPLTGPVNSNGEVLRYDLAPGSYTLEMTSILTGCSTQKTIIIPNAAVGTNVPNFRLSTTPAICGPNGLEGTVTIQFPNNFRGKYEIKDLSSAPLASGNVLVNGFRSEDALAPGSYIVDFFDLDDCFVTALTFEIIDSGGGSLNLEQSFCFVSIPSHKILLPSSVNLSDPNIIGFEWKDENGVINNNLNYEVSAPGLYTLSIDYGSCTLDFNIQVNEKCEIQYFAPNALNLSSLTNGSGDRADNVVTLVTSSYVQEVEAYIYNRWGQLIHGVTYTPTTTEAFYVKQIWDGKVNGEYVLAGTYVMVLVFKNLDNNIVKKENQPLVVIR